MAIYSKIDPDWLKMTSFTITVCPWTLNGFFMYVHTYLVDIFTVFRPCKLAHSPLTTPTQKVEVSIT